jgi:hypothetical protein
MTYIAKICWVKLISKLGLIEILYYAVFVWFYIVYVPFLIMLVQWFVNFLYWSENI